MGAAGFEPAVLRLSDATVFIKYLPSPLGYAPSIANYLICASGGTRTHNPFGKQILSLSCKPFHHTHLHSGTEDARNPTKRLKRPLLFLLSYSTECNNIIMLLSAPRKVWTSISPTSVRGPPVRRLERFGILTVNTSLLRRTCLNTFTFCGKNT